LCDPNGLYTYYYPIVVMMDFSAGTNKEENIV
jgi:hypothetical protein